MTTGLRSVLIWVLPLVVLTAACAGTAFDPLGVATRIRDFEFDTYQHIKPRIYEDTSAQTGHAVRILDLDADSMARFGRWPWSRSVLARLTGELKAAGASVVVFDMPLDTADPTEAAGFVQTLPPALQAPWTALASPDKVFAAALAGMPAVTAVSLGDSGPAPAWKSAPQFAGSSEPMAALPQYSVGAGPLPELAAVSAGLGARNLPADRQGEVRSVPLVFALDGRAVPSLDAEVLRLLNPDSTLEIAVSDQGLPGIDSRAVVTGASAGSYHVALGPRGALEVYFAGSNPARIVSAAALDEGRIAPDALKAAVVFIAAPDETVATPLGRTSRAEVRAEALENMLLGSELRPATASQAPLACLVIIGAGLIVLFARGRTLWATVLAVGAIVALQGLAWFLFAHSQMLLDAANPSAGLAAALMVGLGARGFEVAQARTVLKTSFADSFSARTIAAIAKKPSLLKLSGETRVVTCLSCGIRRFAAIAESFADDPAGFTRLINIAMAPLVEDVVGHGGMLVRLDGEGFLACWNAPLDDSEHSIHACEVASRMTVTLAEVNEQLARERRLDGTPYEAIEIGIGISTGSAIAGGFTSNGRTHYAVTGDATVMADRIRGLSATYGPAVVVSEDARKAAQRGFAFLEVDFIAAGPRDEPVKLYAMLGNPLVRASPKFRAMETFHEHIFQSLRLQQWEKAKGLIEQCRKLSGASQKIYDLHLARIAYFEANPPGPDWDGAFRPILK